MLTTLLDVHKSYHVEDELVLQYLVVGIGKAAAVVGLDAALVERVFRLIDTCLRSTHLPTKISALYGCLYLLETGLSDINHHLIPLLTDYLIRSLGSITPLIIYSEQHVLIMWSVAFYLAENYVQEVREFDFMTKLFQLSISVISLDEEEVSIDIYLAILHGLERLILTDCFVGRSLTEPSLVDGVVKLSIDRLCQPNPLRSLTALGLLLTCMYSGLPVEPVSANIPMLTVPAGGSECVDSALYNPETLIVAMERVMVLFDRIRKGYPYEARVITRILPAFLMDFFPPQDIMNKVIAEFLSCQQPHPELMANVVFQVFEKLINMKQSSLVHNWVILSLSNFTQRTPLAMAIWSLTCFFISASASQWLRALMPFAVSRVGRLEAVDHQLFLIAAREFYRQLADDESHRQAFIATFKSVAQLDTPYGDVITVCSAATL
jgi:huntingtin